MSWLFGSGGQSIGASASASVLPINIQGWFPLELTDWMSLFSKRLSRVFSSIQFEGSILWCSAFFIVQISQPYMTTGNTIALIIQTFVGKVMSLQYGKPKEKWLHLLGLSALSFLNEYFSLANCLCPSWYSIWVALEQVGAEAGVAEPSWGCGWGGGLAGSHGDDWQGKYLDLRSGTRH